MNKDLDTIFLQIDPEEDVESRGSEATWCVDQIDDTDIEYVRSDILHEILDKAGIPKVSAIEWLNVNLHGPTSAPRTIAFSAQARISVLAARYKNQTEMRNLYEKKAREAQGEKIASMVRQSRRLSEEEKETHIPSADESSGYLERARYWESQQDASTDD